MEQKKILELSGVTAGYGDKIVLDDIDLIVRRKDFIGIIGANGSGKTTLLRVILGLLKPWKGEIKFFLEPNGNPRAHIGYLPQLTRFDHKFPITVEEVVLSGLLGRRGLFRRFSGTDRQRAHQVLEQMGVLDHRHKPVGELSGGQRQRVLLARALVSSPDLLILDEPDSFVDKRFESGLYEILKELNEKIALLLVSHDIGMIASYVKTIACVTNRLHYHDSNEITQELLDSYGCPLELITHGRVPHRVLKDHGDTRETVIVGEGK